MSLIVEALKKSEAKRRLGQTPNIGTPAMWDGLTASRSNSRFKWWMALAAALVIGAAWWFWSATATKNSVNEAKTNTSVVKKTQSIGSAQSDNVLTSQKEKAALEQLQSGAIFDELTNKPNKSNDKGKQNGGAAILDSKSDPSPAREGMIDSVAMDSKSNSGADATAVDTEALALKRAAEALQQRLKSTSNKPPATALDPTSAATDNTSLTVARVNEPEPIQTVEGNTPTVLPMEFELPPSVRAKLPPVKISMHVFAADPSARFVLINGVRRNQGSELAPKFKLLEIRADGVVLEFEGQSYFMNNPRP